MRSGPPYSLAYKFISITLPHSTGGGERVAVAGRGITENNGIGGNNTGNGTNTGYSGNNGNSGSIGSTAGDRNGVPASSHKFPVIDDSGSTFAVPSRNRSTTGLTNVKVAFEMMEILVRRAEDLVDLIKDFKGMIANLDKT